MNKFQTLLLTFCLSSTVASAQIYNGGPSRFNSAPAASSACAGGQYVSAVNGSAGATCGTPAGTGVPSIVGTTNQINQSGSPGATTLSLSSTIVLPGTINNLTLTAPASAATLTLANNKTFTVSNTLTLAGTDSTSMTFPTTSAIIARTDAGQTFTGTNIFGIIQATSFVPTSSTVPTNGMYLSAANTLNFATNSTLALTISSTGVLTSASNIAGNSGVFSNDIRGIGNASRVQLRASTATILSSPADASWQLGDAAVDTAPVPQTLRSQGTLAGGTSNVAGADWTLIASPGKGTGAGGSFIFQTTPAGSTGTVVGTPTTAMTIDSTQRVLLSSVLAWGSGAVNTGPSFQVTSNILAGFVGTGGWALYNQNNTGTLMTILNNGATAFPSAATSGSSQTGFWCYGTGQTMIADTALCLTSARWGKDRIIDFKPSGKFKTALAETMALKPRNYFYRKDFNGPTFQKNPNYNGAQIGFIGDEVGSVDPRLATLATDGKHKGDFNSVRYQNMVALLTKDIQEQQKEITDLETKIRVLEKRYR